MHTLDEIERAVQELSPEQLSKFRTWFTEFEWAAWDGELEEDVAAGRLDEFADEALADLRAGRTRPL